MTWTSEGIYRHGTIELPHAPDGLREGRVLVTMTQPEDFRPAAQYLQRGKHKSERVSSEKDFETACWRGERELDAD